jgi:hypothetical protein
MRILINLENTDDIREIYIEDFETIENLKYLIEAEFNIPFSQQELNYENMIIDNNRLLIKSSKIKKDDIVVVGKKKITNNLNNFSNMNTGNTNISGLGYNFNISKIFDDTMKVIKSNTNQPNQNLNFNFPNNNLFNQQLNIENKVKSECRKLKEFYINNPDELNYLFNTDEELAEVLVSMDEIKLEELVRKRIAKYEEKRKKEMDDHLKLMTADPNDPEAQKKIEEIIRRKNIDENLKMAQEYLPETLLPVHMLFINVEINKNKIVALVDTGAQTTIISESLAKKCGVFNLCDTRYQGIAKGVGTSKIIGVIHAAQMKIGDK